jgi:hypothetical protein
MRFTSSGRVPAIALLATFWTTALFAQSDTIAPILTGLTLSRTTVDVTAAAQTINVTATATDDLSGGSSITVGLTTPSGLVIDTFTGFGLTSGTPLNGTYTGVLSIPRYAVAGSYSLGVYLFDFAGNYRSMTTAELASAGFPSAITVIDATPDTVPPSLMSASISPSTIDVSTGPQDVTVLLNVTDNISGTSDRPQDACFPLRLAGPTGFPEINFNNPTLVAGTRTNGTWRAVVRIPQHSRAGTWSIRQIDLQDEALNSILLQQPQLAAAGTNPTFTVVSATPDTTPPSLTGLSFSPPLFNTSLSAQTVRTYVSATDDRSGVTFAPTTPSCSYVNFGMRSPSAGQAHNDNVYRPAPLVSGTPLAGIHELELNFRRFSEEGTWNVSYFALRDTVGNQVNYTPATLADLGVPSSVVVTRPSLTTDGTLGNAGGTVNDNSFGNRASITVPPGVLGANSNVAIDVFPNPLPVPTPRGFTTPGTYFVNVDFTPHPASPLPAPGITVVLPLINPMTPGALVSLYHIDPVTGQLAPAMTASRTFARGTVNASGLSATFLNVVTLSTVVAYVSTGSTLGDVNGDGSASCADYSLISASMGKRTGQPGFNLSADLNNDTVVDIRDLFIIRRALPVGTVCQ